MKDFEGSGTGFYLNEIDSGVELLERQIQYGKQREFSPLGSKKMESPREGNTALTEYENAVSSAANTGVSRKSSRGGRMSPGLVSREVRSNASRRRAPFIKKEQSLGVMYQNRNRVLSIGDIKGVKGDPAENISSKGVFEQKIPFDIKKSHVSREECCSTKLMKLRRECGYAQGAIQYNKSNETREDRELDHRDHDLKLNYDSSADDLNPLTKPSTNHELLLTFDAKSSGGQMYEQRRPQPATATASQSIRKMKELRRLKNQKGHQKLVAQVQRGKLSS
jgi:hypothetical protein